MDERTVGHIILTLWVFEPVTCICMCCAQLWAAVMITKNRHGLQDRHRYRRTYDIDWTLLGSYGPQFGGYMHCDAGPPHWKSIQMEKTKKVRGWPDGRTYYTATQGIWPCGLRPHALSAIMGCMNDRQNWCRRLERETEVQRDRDIDGEMEWKTCKLDWTLNWVFGP